MIAPVADIDALICFETFFVNKGMRNEGEPSAAFRTPHDPPDDADKCDKKQNNPIVLIFHYCSSCTLWPSPSPCISTPYHYTVNAMTIRQKVFVGMSGGVDSSVSAALLQEQGYDVTGVFIKVWQADFLPCTWREERRDAMRAAAHLGIPFLTLDLEKEYKEEVVDYMIREYGAGRVPNPDVMCNKHVKFGAFLEFAHTQGADFIATGHYARIVASGQSLVTSNKYQLYRGIDKEKDQSYFLWTLTEEQLAYTLFPVGHLQKSQVRELARKFVLPNAEKKDSQGLCFMGAVDMPEFLKHYLKTEKGAVLNESGEQIGTHDGALLYTIGQRHGFSIDNTSATEQPYFVIGKDVTHNSITVAHRDPDGTSGKLSAILIDECNVVSARLRAPEGEQVLVRTRYREPLVGGRWKISGDHEAGRAQIIFDHPHEVVATGQSVVVYDGEECLGGGVMAA